MTWHPFQNIHVKKKSQTQITSLKNKCKMTTWHYMTMLQTTYCNSPCKIPPGLITKGLLEPSLSMAKRQASNGRGENVSRISPGKGHHFKKDMFIFSHLQDICFKENYPFQASGTSTNTWFEVISDLFFFLGGFRWLRIWKWKGGQAQKDFSLKFLSKDLNIYIIIPWGPCMVYLPTFTIKIN